MQRKMIFDAVRRLLGRGFARREVEALDAAINRAQGEPARPPELLTVGPEGIALIKRFEGLARLRGDGLVEAYPDPGTGASPGPSAGARPGRAIARATLTRRHVAGDQAAAAREFARWNRAGGRVLAGLTRRRAAEAALYVASTPGGISATAPAELRRIRGTPPSPPPFRRAKER